MGIGRIGRSPLTPVTHRAPVTRGIMNDIGVAPIERIAVEAAFTRRHADMAAHAPIRGSDFAADDLAQLNRERLRLGCGKLRPDLALNHALNHAPIAQEVFMDGGPQQHRQRAEA